MNKCFIIGNICRRLIMLPNYKDCIQVKECIFDSHLNSTRYISQNTATTVNKLLCQHDIEVFMRR